MAPSVRGNDHLLNQQPRHGLGHPSPFNLPAVERSLARVPQAIIAAASLVIRRWSNVQRTTVWVGAKGLRLDSAEIGSRRSLAPSAGASDFGGFC
jgi:hypothetical protein